MQKLSRSTAAAANAASVWLDPALTADKAVALIAEAARHGAAGYNRFDVFDLTVHRRRPELVSFPDLTARKVTGAPAEEPGAIARRCGLRSATELWVPAFA